MGGHLSIDATALTNGELNTIIINKAGKGRKGALVAMIEGTGADKFIAVLNEIPETIRGIVKEVTLDMANSMRKKVSNCFPGTRVIDRFHVQRLAYDALQEMRIAHRWDAINEEANAIENAKADGKKYLPLVLENGDTKKQLLARIRYLLFKSGDKWTEKQKHRAAILFKLYPDIKQAYSLIDHLRKKWIKTSACIQQQRILWFFR